MPITYQLRAEEKLAIVVHSETVTDGEFLSFYEALYRDPRFDKSFNLLVDLQRAESTVRTSEALRKLADFMVKQYAETPAGPKVAVVAPRDISFGLARMYEAMSPTVPWQFEIVRSVDDALAWLGLPKELMLDVDQDSHGEGSRDSK